MALGIWLKIPMLNASFVDNGVLHMPTKATLAVCLLINTHRGNYTNMH
jgi:hypothetical protein